MSALIDLLRITGLSGWIAFAVVYHFGTGGAWRYSRMGPWIMGLCLVPLLTLIVGVITSWFGVQHLVALTARLFLMIVVNLMPLWLSVLFVRRQREIGGSLYERSDSEPAPGAADAPAAGSHPGGADRSA